MDTQEQKVYGLMKRLTIRDDLKQRAANLISVLGKYFTASNTDDLQKKEKLAVQLKDFARKMKKVEK